MAGQPVVRVEGGRQLRAALRRAGDDLADLRRVNADVADVVARAGRQDAPKRSGRLAASVRPGGGATAAVVRAGGAAVPYAGVIHYGWAARHIRPQPFLIEGATETQPHWLNMYQAEVDRLLAQIERTAHP